MIDIPAPRGIVPSPVLARFWSKVEARPNGCWEWTRATNGVGYGYFGVKRNRNVLAHRFSYLIQVGPLPASLFVLHACDNPPCVNPVHLFLGTQSDNMQDALRKGRCHKDPRKLTPDQERQVLAMRAAGTSFSKIARTFGIGHNLAWLTTKRAQPR